MNKLYGLTFQLEDPTPNKPTKVISIMVDEKGEKYINYLHQKLRQKENIIKEVREKLEYLLTHDKVEINGTIYLKQEADDYITNYILEILEKENKE